MSVKSKLIRFCSRFKERLSSHLYSGCRSTHNGWFVLEHKGWTLIHDDGRVEGEKETTDIIRCGLDKEYWNKSSDDICH